MGLFTGIASALDRKSGGAITYGTIDLWRDLFGGAPVKSGVTVNVQTALQVTTVLGCVRRIAEGLMVPCKVYIKDPATGARSEARSHELFDILQDEPNSIQSGLEYRETLALHLALTFNHYSYISRVNGKIDELIPIDPCRVVPKLGADYRMTYRVQLLDGSYQTFGSDEIWHIRGPSWDGAIGMDAIKLLREAVGLAIATEETHARLHSNGAQPGGILTTDNRMDPATLSRLKEMLAQGYGGVSNKFRTLVLDNGLKWQAMTPNGVDIQHLELRQFQVEEICRSFNVMPIMVGYSGDKAPTFASAEQMFLQHLVHTVRPWQSRVAASAKRWLFTREERRLGYYIRFVDADFIAPDMKSKAEYNKIALGGGGNPGWRLPNEARGDDELGPLPGGDRLYVPMNTIPIGDDGFPRPNAVPAAKTSEAQ
jgi:HK97 family phage portal protein